MLVHTLVVLIEGLHKLTLLSYNDEHLLQGAPAKAKRLAEGNVFPRQVKYLNNLVEQDHRCIKRLTTPGMSCFSFETAGRALQGFEVMNMIRKGQRHGVAKGEVRGQVALVALLFGVVA